MDYELAKLGDNYYIKLDGSFQKIVSVNGKAPFWFVFPTIGKNGMSWGLFASEDRQKRQCFNVVTESTRIKLNLKKLDYKEYVPFEEQEDLPEIEVYEKNDYVYINANSCDCDDDAKLKTYYSKIKSVSHYENIVIDVCDNGGGSDEVVKKIMGIVGVKNQNYPCSMVDLACRIDGNVLAKERKKRIIERYKATLAENINISFLRFGESNRIKETKKRIIVLQNRNSFSAAEDFNELFSNYKNVVFVGDNTAGMLHFGNIMHYRLRNSGIDVRFGASLFKNLGGVNVEGKGLAPDIYFDKGNYSLDERLEIFCNKKLFKLFD